MKFGRRIQEEAYESYKPHYIAYKELKKAIKLITGSDTSNFTITEVTANFGNLTGFNESSRRPPEAQFQNLLNFEIDKVNSFSAVVYSNICSTFQGILKELFAYWEEEGDIPSLKTLDRLKKKCEKAADEVIELHSYVCLNFTGFRKITKKYDKHSHSSAFCWYFARLVKEKFVNLNFDYLIELIALAFDELRSVRDRVLRETDREKKAQSVPPTVSPLASLNSTSLQNEATTPTIEALETRTRNPEAVGSLQETERSLTFSPAALSLHVPLTPVTYLVGEENAICVRVHLAKHLSMTALGPVKCRPRMKSALQALIKGIPQGRRVSASLRRDATQKEQQDLSSAHSAVVHTQASFTNGISRAAELPASVEVPVSTPPTETASTHISISDDATGCFTVSSIYKSEQHRVSTCCLYFDEPGALSVYKAVLRATNDKDNELHFEGEEISCGSAQRPSVENMGPEVLRLRWTVDATVPNAGNLSEIYQAIVPQSVILEVCDAFAFEAPPVQEEELLAGVAWNGITSSIRLPLAAVGDLVFHRKLDISRILAALEATSSFGGSPDALHTAQSVLRRAQRVLNERPLAPSFQQWFYRTSYCRTPSSAQFVNTKQKKDEAGILSLSSPVLSPCMFAQFDENVQFVDAALALQRQDTRTAGTVTGGETLVPHESVPPAFWLPPHFAYLVEENDGGLHKCPFGILTLALPGGQRPDFLARITGLTGVTEIWRYSPVLHGTALFERESLGFSFLPHWFKLITGNFFEEGDGTTRAGRTESGILGRIHRGSWLLDSSRPKLKSKKNSNSRTAGASSSACRGHPKGVDAGTGARVDVMSTLPRDRIIHEHDAAHPRHESVGLPNAARQPVLTSSQGSNHPRWPNPPLTEPLLGGDPLHLNIEHARTPFCDAQDVYPRTMDTRIPVPLGSTYRQPLFSVSLWNGFIGGIWKMGWCRLTDFVYGESGNAFETTGVRSATVRVEPKAFFANERTLLQWLNTAVLLSTISITLLNFGTASGRLAGMILAPVAVFFILYSFLVYLRRSYSLERKKPINYNDRVGPAILVICLVGALCAVIILNIVNAGKP